ncbi:sensor domain-containing diguanylate cyclase [Limnoglobus roseus]|uniref:diguanylate cyclase n=1 Tax=Limnoglobus roseus TaxID=2598579 RepID=A0A5C1ABT1_9BACT|nr:diguanylate cyclase [Limnoglobus roseus]QEL16829.1 diguanylate cyclase [Limnoglobus roseus]
MNPSTADPFVPALLCRYFSEQSPQPALAVGGPTHVIRYANPSFSRLVGRPAAELIGRPFAEAVPEGVGNGCMMTLDHVFQTGLAESLAEQEHRQASPAHWSYMAWAIFGADGRPAGVLVQVTDATEAARFRQRVVAMNEALVVSSVRQHELLESLRQGEEDRRDLIGQLERQNRVLEEMALSDPLTGLPNRRAIDRIAHTEIVRRTRFPAPLAIGLVDVDHFKDVNTALLLSGGDHVLTWLAGVLKTLIRASDAIGRVGGEEFMVVAPGTDAGGAEALAERLRANVAAAATAYQGHPVRVTVSVGFATVGPGSLVGYDQLRGAAESALQEAKETGRNKCVIRSV